MADDVGMGKTKQLLLTAYFHTILADETVGDSQNIKVLYRPSLLVVPPASYGGWDW